MEGRPASDVKNKLKKLSRGFLSKVLKVNYLLGNYQEVAWIIGDGRSGTTWLSRLINYRRHYRDMFEPIHPELVQQADFLQPLEYVRPGQSYPQLERLIDLIVSGDKHLLKQGRYGRTSILTAREALDWLRGRNP